MLPLIRAQTLPVVVAVCLLFSMVGCSRVIRVTIHDGDQTLIVGATKQLTVTVLTAGSASREVRWSSSMPRVASVTPTGRLAALEDGETQITATSVYDAAFSATVTITVEALPDVSVRIPPEGGAVSLSDYASVTFPMGAFTTPQDVRLAVVVDPGDVDVANWLDEHAAALFEPIVKLDYVVRIETGSTQPATAVDVSLQVPDAVLDSLSRDSVGLFVVKRWQACTDFDCAFAHFEQIGATYEPATRRASATLKPSDFTDEGRFDTVNEAIVSLAWAHVATPIEPRQVDPLPAHCPADGFGPPLDRDLDVVSQYGTRVHPIHGTTRRHDGVDYRAEEGTAVLAADEGRVTRVYHQHTDQSNKSCTPPSPTCTSGGYGVTVIIKHEHGATLYAHLQDGSVVVSKDDQVSKGQKIASSGNTGTSSGPHLHFEYKTNLPGDNYFAREAQRQDPHPCVVEEETPNEGGDASTAPGQGVTFGDPHMRTFDRMHYTFHGVGDYVLSRSTAPDDDFEVQVRFVPFTRGGRQWSANGAVAAKVEGDVVEVQVGASGPELYLNEVMATGAGPHLLAGGGSVAIAERHVVVSWPDATTLEVRLLQLNTSQANDVGSVTLLLPRTRAGLVEGLLGNFDGDRGNDLRLRDGEVVTDIRQRKLYDGGFRDSWSVALGASPSLFSQGVDPFDASFPAMINDLADFELGEVDAVRQTCATRGVVDAALLDTCALDLLVSGDETWADVAAAIDANTPSIRILPLVARVEAGGERQLAAVVTGVDDVGVTWSLEGPGSLVADGASRVTYTAPDMPAVATIRVVSEAIPSMSALATLIVLEPITLPTGAVSTVTSISGQLDNPYGAFRAHLIQRTVPNSGIEDGAVRRTGLGQQGGVSDDGRLSIELRGISAGTVHSSFLYPWCGESYRFITGTAVVSEWVADPRDPGTEVRVEYLRQATVGEFSHAYVWYVYSLDTHDLTCAGDPMSGVADVDVRIRPGWNVLTLYSLGEGHAAFRTGEPTVDVPWLGPDVYRPSSP